MAVHCGTLSVLPSCRGMSFTLAFVTSLCVFFLQLLWAEQVRGGLRLKMQHAVTPTMIFAFPSALQHAVLGPGHCQRDGRGQQGQRLPGYPPLQRRTRHAEQLAAHQPRHCAGEGRERPLLCRPIHPYTLFSLRAAAPVAVRACRSCGPWRTTCRSRTQPAALLGTSRPSAGSLAGEEWGGRRAMAAQRLAVALKSCGDSLPFRTPAVASTTGSEARSPSASSRPTGCADAATATIDAPPALEVPH